MRIKIFVVGIGIASVTILTCGVIVSFLALQMVSMSGLGSDLNQLTSDLHDMTDLQQNVMAAYRTQAVEVNITNGYILTVSLVNSPFNQLSQTEGKIKAREIAQFVKQSYAGIDKIDTIRVSFVESNQFLIFSSSRFEMYVFEKTSLSAD